MRYMTAGISDFISLGLRHVFGRCVYLLISTFLPKASFGFSQCKDTMQVPKATAGQQAREGIRHTAGWARGLPAFRGASRMAAGSLGACNSACAHLEGRLCLLPCDLHGRSTSRHSEPSTERPPGLDTLVHCWSPPYVCLPAWRCPSRWVKGQGPGPMRSHLWP